MAPEARGALGDVQLDEPLDVEALADLELLELAEGRAERSAKRGDLRRPGARELRQLHDVPRVLDGLPPLEAIHLGVPEPREEGVVAVRRPLRGAEHDTRDVGDLRRQILDAVQARHDVLHHLEVGLRQLLQAEVLARESAARRVQQVRVGADPRLRAHLGQRVHLLRQVGDRRGDVQADQPRELHVARDA